MIRINLLPVRHSRRQEAVINEMIIAGIGLAIICVAMFGMYAVVSSELGEARDFNRGLQKQIDKTKKIVAEVDQQEKFSNELNVKLRVIKRLKANRVGPVHMLDELSQATPEKLQLTQVEEVGGKVSITGVAVTNEVISDFLGNLERSDYFSEVYLNAIDQTETSGVKLKEFSISGTLVVPGIEELDAEEEGEESGKKGKKGKKGKAKD
ncbi:MAG: PilN domain-containing protein [Myxococcota bacterium]|nr:PilN domain-containing protein [Myxococcota bacterium]